ncbi:hypothetical protein SERLADRAFT_372518 [Serpula lacrymans var. lacrymans S7.9]|uniref:DNA repair protein rhp7 treble clef domain-containing protein n=1 Tax=Serpula lacrymans var. lacrymans (strain S7.9) TaxID=578457 RepID=F8P5I6_SERL9|nr:uncharacterized protein SERLADRAFT_372518 [Serpula lacrymans var. lacrymans S7.9]EGO21873.1 hypothetical protein SERLADRAFT_372518 [Serpula lacrymans var. lacrymans S7.9]
MSKAAQAKLKEKEKAKAKKKAKKDDDDDAYTALSKNLWTSGSKPPVGSFETCAECEKQFTVTRYTIAANPGPGYLCHSCAKSGGNDPFKKPAAPRKRKVPGDKREVVNFEKIFPTLANICIEIITRHIDDVEALGNIGTINMDEISKALSKNRGLTPQNAPLFYDIQNTTLNIYDATSLTPPALQTLAHLNPNLTSLRLDFCGRIDNEVIADWCKSLPALTHLELFGPFLVRAPMWQTFFKSHPNLQSFLITQSPRFDDSCARSMAENCKSLRELRLKEVGKLCDEFTEPLKALPGLKLLDLSDPSVSMSEASLIDLMAVHGPTLTHLNLSGHKDITDAFLVEGIKPHARSLTSLTLSNVPLLTDVGVAGFFNTWADIDADMDGQVTTPNPPLVAICLSRNTELSSEALTAMLSHSGRALTHLNINGWKSVSSEALAMLSQAKDLKELDVGWCREVDDFVMKDLVEGCNHLKEVKCWGCNRVTGNSLKRSAITVYGIEAQSM